MQYSEALTNYEIILLLMLIIAFYLFVFLIIPTIYRDVEKSKISILSFRGFAVFGNRYFKRYGTFNRITTYDDFFLIVFLGYEKINYSDIRNLNMKYGQFNSLSMLVHGVPISICGRLNQLQNLHETLKKAIHTKT